MTYSLACNDVMPGCDATFSAESADELMSQVATHAAEGHGITELTPEVLATVQAAVKQS